MAQMRMQHASYPKGIIGVALLNFIAALYLLAMSWPFLISPLAPQSGEQASSLPGTVLGIAAILLLICVFAAAGTGLLLRWRWA